MLPVGKNWQNLWALPESITLVGKYLAKLESWTSIGSLAMGSLFVSMMISFYAFLIGPEGEGPNVDVDPGALLAQTISISAHLVSFWRVSYFAYHSEVETSLRD